MAFFKLLWSFVSRPKDWLELIGRSEYLLDSTYDKQPVNNKNRTMWG